jgi:hypothetical protein
MAAAKAGPAKAQKCRLVSLPFPLRDDEPGDHLTMPSPSAAERKAIEIADDFVTAEFDDDTDAKAWLVDRIAAALEKAEEAGYKRAMAKRF